MAAACQCNNSTNLELELFASVEGESIIDLNFFFLLVRTHLARRELKRNDYR